MMQSTSYLLRLGAIMTQHEVISAILEQIPPMKRPAHVSDREFVETYLSLQRSIEAVKRGEKGTIVGWADLKRKLTGEG